MGAVFNANRRDLLKGAAGLVLATTLPLGSRAQENSGANSGLNRPI
jgi:hypothetical protein